MDTHEKRRRCGIRRPIMNGTEFSGVLQQIIDQTLETAPPDSPLRPAADGGRVVDYPVILHLPAALVAIMEAMKTITIHSPANLIEEIVCNTLCIGPTVLLNQPDVRTVSQILLAYADLKREGGKADEKPQ
jgi:hypothetical protein